MHLNIRWSNNVIEVLRYKVCYIEEASQFDTKTMTHQVEKRDIIRFFPTLDSALNFNHGVPIKLDYESYEWLDGISVKDCNTFYEEAMRIYEMGEEAYKKSLLQKSAQTNEQLYSDVSQCILSMIS